MKNSIELMQEQRQTLEQLEDEQFANEYYIQKSDTLLPRWVAEGFWFLSVFVRAYTNHYAWEQTIAREPEYFRKAYERLDNLASWFFAGRGTMD